MRRSIGPFHLRTLILALAGVVVFAPVANVAHAQLNNIRSAVNGGGIPAAITGNLPEAINGAYENIIVNLTRAGVTALFNAATVFFGQIAYDTATAIAAGGKGQEALIFHKEFGSYLQDVASDAAGEFIGSLSSDFFQNAGFDLCQPTDPRTLLRIQMSLGNFFPGLQGRFQRPRPRCDLKQVLSNYEQIAQTPNADLLDALNFSYDPNASELGVTTQIFSRSIAFVASETEAQRLARQEGRGFRSLTSVISGEIKTPAAVIQTATDKYLVNGPYEQQVSQISTMLGTAFEQGAIQLAAYTASVFLNTLASKTLQRIFDKGLFGAFDFSKPSRVLTSPDAIQTAGRLDARKANIDLRTPNLLQTSEVEIVSELIACPADSRGLWNCAMDQDLAQALQSQGDAGGVTVRQAIKENKLHGDWRLLPDTMVKENRDRLCYTYGYCVGNLRKLRAARILPVGIEFAADSQENRELCVSSRGCVTLKEVVDGFAACNGSGERDASHPWCRLVDPNWVLTSVPQQCQLQGYGDNLLSGQLSQRRQECQDVQTCLKRNDRGECVGGYGYCLAEKTVYRFQGDECPAKFASCRAYTTRAGQGVAYLRNTTDASVCSADNVGCYWYSTQRDADGNWVGATGGVGTAGTPDRIYFDKTLEPCSASDDGCTKVLGFRPGQSALNLLANGSFEEVQGTANALTNWLPADQPFTAPTVTDGYATISGAAAYAVAASPLNQQVQVQPGRTMTFSVYARKQTDAGGALDVLVVQYRDQTFAAASAIRESGTDYRSPSCRAGGIGILATPADTAWQRYECTFLTSGEAQAIQVEVRGSNMLVDDVQLEDGEFASGFVNGLGDNLDEVHLKLPQDDLKCTGEATDPAACSKFARLCRQTEAGCQGYTDAKSGGAEVPAIISTNDLCPASCVGYADYRKQASAFDLTRDTDTRFDDPADPVSNQFIPSTAEQCRREDVGCEEFTSLEGAATGGETRSYYSYVRACEKPDDNSHTYFTWEGSETAGYQLRTWSLKREPPAAAGTAPGPRVLVKKAPGQAFFKDPAQCNAASWQSGADPDCRQFYDADGNVFYRYYSQTILSSNDCTSARITRTSQADCEKTGGTFTVATGACVYQLYAPESLTCRAEAAGCRAYNGPSAGNVQNVLVATFRDGVDDFTTGFVSTEALLVGDQSLRLDGGTETRRIIPTTPGKLYTLSFWAKVPGRVDASVTVSQQRVGDASARTVVGQAALSSDWQRFSVGPFVGLAGETSVELVWTFTSPGGAIPAVYLDEVTAQSIEDVVYVRAGTWTTPAECDATTAGTPQQGAMLGCRTYKDRYDQSVNVRQFTRLCREAAIGCRAFVDTRNSDSVQAQTFTQSDVTAVPISNNPADGNYGPATTVRPADRVVYAIDTPEMRCKPEGDSCRAFGKPSFSSDRSRVAAFDTVYIKDDVNQYSQALCRPSEMFCEEFKTDAGVSEYFRDPQNHACEYRTNVELTEASAGVPGLPSGAYSGWFIKGESRPCYPNAREGGVGFGIVRTGDTTYAGYAGMCEEQYGECTEFRDPRDTSDPRFRSGKPYYFIANDRLDTKSCNGNVDTASGCVLLRDMSRPEVGYSSLASYAKYEQNKFDPTPPINCDVASPDPTCAKVKVCNGTKTSVKYVSNKLTVGGGSVQVGPGGVIPGGITLPGLIPPISTGASLLIPVATTTAWTGNQSCSTDSECHYVECFDANGNPAASNCAVRNIFSGTCSAPGVRNDANVVVKVKLDRDCAQWLGCRSAETVLDPATGRYRDICTNVALCDTSSEKPGDLFCANYVNRTTTSSEPILAEGAFFNIDQYAARRTGLGEKDYSGYAIPDSFLAADVASVRVGADGAIGVADANHRFALDYRLAAAVKIKTGPCAVEAPGCTHPVMTEGSDNDAVVIPPSAEPQRTFPALKLCKQVKTGIIGYYVQTERKTAEDDGSTFNCYLPVTWSDLSANFHNLYTAFNQLHPDYDSKLSAAFPPPECRANPEGDSPFPTRFVTAWDLSKNPPIATAKLPGFTSVNTCEYGEDCSCSYKRADYAASSKFFNTYSDAVPPGICLGGPRNGQACLPETIFKLPQEGQAATAATPAIKAIEGSNAAQTCGPLEGGGQCIAWSKLEIVRGVFGQCLERDITRVEGGDESIQPCLTWNPTPILFGEKDPYHFQPTSGYLPPQNSGQYYCTSFARSPRTLALNPDYFAQSSGKFAGNMKVLNFNDDYTSEGDALGGNGGDRGSRIDGGKPNGNDGSTCEYADDDQSPAIDDFALRLVGTGRGLDKSYTETFFPINPDTMAQWLSGDDSLHYITAPTDPPSIGEENNAGIDAILSDYNIASFTVQPMQKNHLGCGYQEDWVDNVHSSDYDDGDKTKAADQLWKQGFYLKYNPALTRGSEGYLQDKASHPLFDKCVREPTKDCVFKYWETGYRSDSQPTFLGLQTLSSNGEKLDEIRASLMELNKDPLYRVCSSDKPYYAIRAVFEFPTDRIPEVAPHVPLDREKILPADMVGAWRFVGFWVTTCGGKSTDERYIYVNVDLHSADICKQLAEVKSVNTNQDAAFTDRVWKDGRFTVPGNGIQYGARSSPFSSALNTGPAGKDPLFQTGGSIAGFSPLNPPTFLQSGVDTYFRSTLFPKDKYAYLSNLFARIYRLYTYQALPVEKTDNACLIGPFKGKRCLPNRVGTVSRRSDCGYGGLCDTSLIPKEEVASFRGCNVQSGMNQGLTCSRNEDCKAPILTKGDGTRQFLYTKCEVQSGWQQDTDQPGYWRNGAGATLLTQEAASDAGAFKCAAESVNAGDNCKNPGQESAECPLMVTGRCQGGTPSTPGTCVRMISGILGRSLQNVYTGDIKSCNSDTDCGFTDVNYAQGACVRLASGAVSTLAGALAGGSADSLFTVIGRCQGGVREGNVCGLNDPNDPSGRSQVAPGTNYSCNVAPITDAAGVDLVQAAYDSCQPVSNKSVVAGTLQYSPVPECQKDGDATITASNDPDKDNNTCTHGVGYYPDINICPDPTDEFCGLISYRITRTGEGQSMDPKGPYPLPTDVTMGLYTPLYLGYSGPEHSSVFTYIDFYTPRPPRIAAPDTTNCSTGGSCPIQRLDMFSFANQSEGIVTADGGQFKASLRFYGWAAHDQMPLRKVSVDWGDNQLQELPDARLKNHKPYCGVQKECSDPLRGVGLTCNSDSDCPPGAGSCQQLGTCSKNPFLSCRSDNDCSIGTSRDTCNVRTMFGNSTDACEPSYFDFTHLYTCTGPAGLPTCNDRGSSPPSDARCSRDPDRPCSSNGECAAGDTCVATGLAPKGGCWDTATNSCRFTPRVFLQDNWGWCSGECRSVVSAGGLDDPPSANVRHPYGGCFAGGTQGVDQTNVRFNTPPTPARFTTYLLEKSECKIDLSNSVFPDRRPWIVFPGSLQLQSSGELQL